jgi:hypothetical protein
MIPYYCMFEVDRYGNRRTLCCFRLIDIGLEGFDLCCCRLIDMGIDELYVFLD